MLGSPVEDILGFHCNLPGWLGKRDLQSRSEQCDRLQQVAKEWRNASVSYRKASYQHTRVLQNLDLFSSTFLQSQWFSVCTCLHLYVLVLVVVLVRVLVVAVLDSSIIFTVLSVSSQIPVLINLSQDADVNLPVKPLIFALAMGACLGGAWWLRRFASI